MTPDATIPPKIHHSPSVTSGFFYLATPYRAYPHGLEAAHSLAQRAAALLIRQGLIIYSPIVHCHPIAFDDDVCPDSRSDFWLGFQLPFFKPALGMIWLDAPGANESSGMKYERQWFLSHQKPIFFLRSLAATDGNLVTDVHLVAESIRKWIDDSRIEQ